MTKVITAYRRLKIITPKIIPLVTEEVEKPKAIVRSDTTFIELAAHQLTRDLKKFLEDSGFKIETTTTTARRGKAEIAGIPVKVYPLNHTNYDGGAEIFVAEDDQMRYDNTNIITAHLIKNGINIEKECTVIEEKTETASCLFKRRK